MDKLKASRAIARPHPFIRRTPILFHDVDAAGTAYYPRLIDLCHCAFESFFNERIGPDYSKVIASGTGFPAVHFEVDFVSPIRHGDLVDISVTVAEIGKTSVTLVFEAKRGKVTLFRAKNVVVAVDIRTMTKKRISPRMRTRFKSAQLVAEGGRHKAGG